MPHESLLPLPLRRLIRRLGRSYETYGDQLARGVPQSEADWALAANILKSLEIYFERMNKQR